MHSGVVQLSTELKNKLIDQIRRVVTSSSQSNIPTIYGMTAQAEVKRLRPSADTADVEQLGEVRCVQCQTPPACICLFIATFALGAFKVLHKARALRSLHVTAPSGTSAVLAA